MTEATGSGSPGRPARPGPLLGIDHGAHVIGFALCDASWIVARPLGLLRRTTRAADFAHIRALATKHEARAIVVGLPLMPRHFEGHAQSDTVRRWATRLAAAVPLPVFLWDESLSTFEAAERAADAGLERAGRQDDRAAAIMLQSFIDAHPPGSALPQPVRRAPML
ncbi:MAG: Holliday junction resolvase RuvX [Anaerolineae bacterium]|nr:Holliday junction resolvase RuvX [Anaerolineae bacterium]